jgi:hypothetical protein
LYNDAAPAKVGQGTIVREVYFYAVDETLPGLSLTPVCDIEQVKAELIQFCALFDAWELVTELVKTEWNLGLTDATGALVAGPLSNTKKNAFHGHVRQLIAQRIPRYHWLAPLPGTTPPLIADFQVLASVVPAELEQAELVAELRSPYREQTAARYSAYMGRVGTPDFTQEQIDGWLAQSLMIFQ